MNFLCLLLSPRAILDVLTLVGKVWVLAPPRMATHVSHAWTSLAFKSVGGGDSRRPRPALRRLIHGS